MFPEIHESQPALRQFHLISLVLALCTLGVAALVLIGWSKGIVELQTLGLSNVNMKTNAALGIAIAACGVLLSLGTPRFPHQFLIVRICGAFVAFIGGMTLFEHISGMDVGIDQLLFDEADAQMTFTTSPNRMGPPGSLCLLLAGMSLLLFESDGVRWRSANWPALALLATAILPTTGYLYGAETLYGVARFTGIAPHTSTTFILLAIALLLARPHHHPMRILSEPGPEAELARFLIPASIILPLAFGFILSVGQRQLLFDGEFGRALLVVAVAVSFSALIWTLIARLSRISRARRNAEYRLAALLDSERAARHEAEQMTRLKDDFLATLSHELRTPLNAILGWITLLRRKKSAVSPEIIEGLDVIERNSRSQARLIEDLLDVSRIVSGKLSLHFESVDIATLTTRVVENIIPIARGKGLRLGKNICPECNVRGDPARIEQVLTNLLSNAIKFTPNGGTISVDLERDGDNAVISVKDSGQGISEEFLPHLFNRFRQQNTSASKKLGGLGIGLSVAKSIVEMHGGAIEGFSEGEGKGSLFRVRLPLTLATEASKPPPQRQDSGELRNRPSDLNGLRILVVEDEADAREMLSRHLSSCGAVVMQAANASEGIEACSQNNLDLLISDIGMPTQDGYEMIERIRKGGKSPAELPAIALTAYAREQDRARAFQSGFQAHLAKPLNVEQLLGTIHSLLQPQAG